MVENVVFNQSLAIPPQSPQHRLDKKKGVSGECSTLTQEPVAFPKQSKPIKYNLFVFRFAKWYSEIILTHLFKIYYRTKHLIKQALCKNPFLKNLNTAQISEIVDVMYPKDFEAGAYVIRKGDPGKQYSFSIHTNEVRLSNHIKYYIPNIYTYYG